MNVEIDPMDPTPTIWAHGQQPPAGMHMVEATIEVRDGGRTENFPFIGRARWDGADLATPDGLSVRFNFGDVVWVHRSVPCTPARPFHIIQRGDAL